MSIYCRETWENIPAAFEAPEILRLLVLWEREPATGTQPNIDQFDLDQMPEIAPHAVVLTVLPDNDYCYDHCGSAIAKLPT
jgi:hypothetical protein